jgi:hypothetical protein
MADGGRGNTTDGDGYKAATAGGSSQAEVYTKTPVSLRFQSRLLFQSSGLTVYSRDGGSKFL